MKRTNQKSGRRRQAQKNITEDTDLLRINKVTMLLNNREIRAIDYYCREYGIQNRSKFMRELILSSIIKKFEDNYPTLF
ncbi:MAG: hypothetical protein LBS09_04305 [Bacteroidales bacterium]|jgi:ATP-dependent helicase/DNAse subunit B|nr:hypothetical protein [Bacteroidales bacterium]